MKKKREEKASIALYVLISMVFFAIILVGLYVSSSNKLKKQESQIRAIREKYSGQDAYNLYKNVNKKVSPNTSIADSTVKLENDYGTIDVIWLDGITDIATSVPNPPVMKNGMTKVTWTKGTDNTWVEDKVANDNWYNYVAGVGTKDNLESRWANAKNTVDGNTSYFVWIPRYAYRITYYDKNNKVSGYYDGYGMWNSDGKLKYELDSGVGTTEFNGYKYIVHPAFCGKSKFGSGYDNGQWATQLQGFWVAKYEMSRKGASSDKEDTSDTYDKIQFLSAPGVSSARNINVGNLYTVAKAYDTTKNSHLMKNSEWGAVAYLTHSQYGRNGYEIDINNSLLYITGNGGGKANASTSSDTVKTYAYNTETGTKASSTGNIYGVYDLSGGACEYVAGFDGKGSLTYVDDSLYGQAMTSTVKDSTGYKSNNFVTVYSNGKLTSSGSSIFDICKVGDATKEVWKSDSTGWNGDYLFFVGSDSPFFLRGGSYANGSSAGVYYSNSSNGSANGDYSFRVVLNSL